MTFELSFDQFNENAKEIYRVINDRSKRQADIPWYYNLFAVRKAMHDVFPEVVKYTRLEPFGTIIIRDNDKKVGDETAKAVDNSFFATFSYPLIAGNNSTALKEPYTTIISETSGKNPFFCKKPLLRQSSINAASDNKTLQASVFCITHPHPGSFKKQDERQSP